MPKYTNKFYIKISHHFIYIFRQCLMKTCNCENNTKIVSQYNFYKIYNLIKNECLVL